VDEQGREAFRAYVSQRYPALVRTAYLLTGSRPDAEDLVQTALAKTWLGWDRIRDRDALDGYVRRVMVNTQTSFWRRRKITAVLTDAPPERDDGRDEAHGIALHDALWTALAGLPARQRAIVVLRYYEDLSEAETAEVLGISVGTVKSATSRALAKLRDEPGLHEEPKPDHRPTRPTGALS
jgi:RNA polymerase sigma-70 factor (sigma-E family)